MVVTKKIIAWFLLLFAFFKADVRITFYKGYWCQIPKECIGTVKLPIKWEAKEENGLVYFFDKETGEIIAEEYSFTKDYRESNKIINPKYQDYELKESDSITGNSNGSQYFWRIYRVKETGEEIKFFGLTFSGDYGEANLTMFLLREESESLMRQVTRTYKYPQYS